MIKALSISILILLCIANLKAQNIGATKITLPANLSKFIPKGYALLDTARGNVNEDQYRDVILVLKIPGEDTALDAIEYKRPVLILLGNGKGSFSLAARNDNIVYCVKCGGMFGDGYAGLTVKNGGFTVNHFGGSNQRWSNDITFKYAPAKKTWYLYKIVDKGWSVFDLDKVETNIRTKKTFGTVRFEDYTDEIN